MQSLAKHAGTAIFMALLVVAIVVSLTVVIVRYTRLDIQRTQMLVTAEQSYLYNQAITSWAKASIIRLSQGNQNTIKWPLLYPSTAIANGTGVMSGALTDAAGLINLNSFSQLQSQGPLNQPSAVTPSAEGAVPPTQAATTTQNKQAMANAPQQQNQGATSPDVSLFENLISILGAPYSPGQKKALVQAIKAWITVPTQTTVNLNDEFDATYAQRNPPYRSPHALMASPSEARLIAGMTPALYNRIQPYLIALPERTSVNLLAAPPAIIKAAELIGKTTPQPTAQNNPPKYFLLRSEVILASQRLLVYSLLTVKNDPNNPQQRGPVVLWQSFGTL